MLEQQERTNALLQQILDQSSDLVVGLALAVPPAALLCLIVAIADGDTLTARCGEPGAYEQIRVRISAIDAPERGQPWGRRAQQALADLCFRVKARIVERSIDRYGRMVADVESAGDRMPGSTW